MDNNIAVRTIVPILLLIGIGFFSRKIGILKSGDERVFSAYVYYFALPALFIVDLAETDFTARNWSRSILKLVAHALRIYLMEDFAHVYDERLKA